MSKLRHLTTSDGASMNSMCAGIAARVSALEGAGFGASISSLTSRMTAAEGGVASLGTRMLAAESAASGLATRVTSLETWRGNKASAIPDAANTTNTAGGLTVLGVTVASNAWAATVDTELAEHKTKINAILAAMRSREQIAA